MGVVEHVSVFSIARLPLVVYAGFRLDDAWAVEVYQRHRESQDWVWRSLDLPPTQFECTGPAAEGEGGVEDHVLLLNVSGTIEPAELPVEHQALPIHRLAATGTPGPDVLLVRGALQAFERVLRLCFAELEKKHPQVKRLFVHGALPVAAAVTFGRCIGPHCPTIHLYEAVDGQRRFAMEFSR